MRKKLLDTLNKNVNNLDTIIKTETQRNANNGILKSYEQAQANGVNLTKMWVATKDGKTRDSHAVLDGKKANEQGLFETDVGLVTGPMQSGVPEFDIGCRCRTIAVIDGYDPEIMRVKGEGVSDYKTYNDWKKAKGVA
jgi:uncharacterized protein with gpF-like domain